MSAIKKNTAKATKSPAPATKEAKSAVKPAAKTSSAKSSAKKNAAATATIVAAVTRAVSPAVVEAVTPALVNEVAVPTLVTTIAAKIDVGFGNALYLRGDGPGLSWDRGIPMTNIGADLWQLQLGESARPFVFKFLVNDVTWSSGTDFVIAAGARELFTPRF